MQTEERQSTQVTTRVPAPLADRLIAIGEAERRSLANLLLLAIEDYVEKYEARLTEGN